MKIAYFFLIIFSFSSFLHPTPRYVKAGNLNPVPPYLSWATASDSIWKALKYAQRGDTVFVANGVYKEYDSIPVGVALIGAGRDSCIIDFSMTSVINYGIIMMDSTTLSGFAIRNTQMSAIYALRNRQSFVRITDNFFSDCQDAMWLAFGEVSGNFISKCNYSGIKVSGYWAPKSCEIFNNIFVDVGYTVMIRYGVTYRVTVRNNVMVHTKLNGAVASVYNYNQNGAYIVNNLFYQQDTIPGLRAYISVETGDSVVNNVFLGPIGHYGIDVYTPTYILNNHFEAMTNAIMINNTPWIYGAKVANNNFWQTTRIYRDTNTINPFQATNLKRDPMFADRKNLDFHLQQFSPLIDAGDSTILDKDGTRSDIGLYGGRYGESYLYKDCPPAAPRGLQISVSGDSAYFKWNRNTESDFGSYLLFKGTQQGFIPDSGSLFKKTADTFLTVPKQLLPIGNSFYKLRAVDKQNNTGDAGTEVKLQLTEVEGRSIKTEKYRLYQNYPNPFNPGTRIGYELNRPGYVKLMIYNINGELVRYLVNEEKEAGYYELDFNPPLKKASTLKEQIASGFYVYSIIITDRETGNPVYQDTKKMLLVR